MSKPPTVRKYGKQSKKSQAGRLFVELPQTPVRKTKTDSHELDDDVVTKLTEDMSHVNIQDENHHASSSLSVDPPRRRTRHSVLLDSPDKATQRQSHITSTPILTPPRSDGGGNEISEESPFAQGDNKELQVLSWAEVCPPGDKIVKIAEASFAEVYRVTNERGTSIIKVIRMDSPIKAQTKAQQKSGLVDEEPRHESDLQGELQISEWVADIPGFVVYKERYIVQGKTCQELLDTHQKFHKRLRRQDLDRLQFYPSPSRYLDDTKFLVIELGDAGTALEDFELINADQVWDVYFHVAIALARAEARIDFEHRDLHEGNLCIREVNEPTPVDERDRSGFFGFSGLEITILDYGLSRAQSGYDAEPVACDLEHDLSIFASEHAPQCQVYRQMRSFLLRGDRTCLPPKSHKKAYEEGIDGPISWAVHEPYTNVLWLAYLYDWMVENFRGPKKEINTFKRATKEFWSYLDPEASDDLPGFESASDIVRYAVEAGWLQEDQLTGDRDEVEKSILSILTVDDTGDGIAVDRSVRRSPRRHRPSAVQRNKDST